LLRECEGVIDFSLPDASIAAARVCAEKSIPIVIATTGHSDAQRAELENLASQMPCLIASNTSLGAAVLGIVAEQAQRLLGAGYDIEVSEIHHRMKRDAPSGTARSIVDGLAASANAPVVFGREGPRAPGEIGVVSLRGGDVPGDHTVYFFGSGERIELSHRVHDRRVFAQGAVSLLLRLSARPAGLYTVRDLLNG
jgi:4-hydroxy-tetrahydrodipicolinate reductase